MFMDMDVEDKSQCQVPSIAAPTLHVCMDRYEYGHTQVT